MRKLYLVILMALFVMPVYAQKTHFLSNVKSSDNFEGVLFYLDENQRVEKGEYTSLGQPYYDRLSFYDENGNLTKIEVHQWAEGVYTFVNYLEYGYNELNQRITRKNYNNFGGVFNLGGTFYYTYDDNGNMVYWELDFMDMIFQKADLTYNENNQVTQELCVQSDFAGGYENSYKLDYEYDNNSRLSACNEYLWEMGTWSLVSKKTYTYDEYGNCTLYEKLVNGQVAERGEYTYDYTLNAENIVVWENPEGEFPALPTMTNAVTLQKYWGQDENFQLVYICDYFYSYEELEVSVEENVLSAACYPNPASSSFMIQSEEVENVEIYNMLGNKVFAGAVNGSRQIDVTDFADGVYVVKMFNEGKVSTTKLVVKK